MSEEESFVILGTSPTPSMESYNNENKIDGNKLPESITKLNKSDLISSTNSDGAFSLLTNSTIKNNISITESTIENKQVYNNDDKIKTNQMNNTEKENKSSGCESVLTNSNSFNGDHVDTALSKSSSSLPFSSLKNPLINSQPEIQKQSTKSSDSANSSLAASFLLGEVSMDEIKENVYSQFPSLCTVGAQTDIVKLQNFVMEYNELKENLSQTTIEMRRLIENFKSWKEDMNVQSQDISDCKMYIQKLQNENLKLKRDLEEKLELMKMNEQFMRQENDDLRKLISEKQSLISNLSVQIERLDQHQHNSFEYVKKDDLIDDKSSKEENDTIPISEHKKMVKEIKRNLSETVAENLELKDMQKLYIDEINALKMNLVSAEELLKKAQVDINLLKSKDLEKTEFIGNYEKDKTEMKQEIELLRMQLDIYRKDFEMERDSRQKLAGEKDQLLMDLKMLQKRNQQLIEETQLRFEKEMNKNSSSIPSSSKSNSKNENTSSTSKKKEDNEDNSTIVIYTCPLCLKKFEKVEVLMEHTQDCIDNM